MTVICMTVNDTTIGIQPILLSPHDSSIIFASSVIGVAVFSLPVACLLYRFGMRTTFPVLMVVSALATAAIPAATHLGLPAIICARICQDLALAAVMPIIGCVTSHWAPRSELGSYKF
ncbi:hypothetical protein WUBG_05908 [Wuchereria bancrofti]|uniref:Major facilitator superfamily (MFS) profile domain-containing protein n=1 Tax=Wuchereria bancrofti TaxID=6293 RepID=J9ELY6_WUCBA|nr:hypothetical protein WUBG_05908 [Wuchereria bancrofti]